MYRCCLCQKDATTYFPIRVGGVACHTQQQRNYHFGCEMHRIDKSRPLPLPNDKQPNETKNEQPKLKEQPHYPKYIPWGEGPTGPIELEAMKRFQEVLTDRSYTVTNLTTAVSIATECADGNSILSARLVGFLFEYVSDKSEIRTEVHSAGLKNG